MDNKIPPIIPEISWIENIAVLLDSKFKVPGTKWKFGLDPIIGLIPVAGNIVTMLISSCLLLIMARYGASRKVILLMTLNILVDTIFGAIPFLGNIFDFGFKANVRNINLLKAHYYENKHQGSGTWIILLILLLFFAVTAGIVYGIYKLLALLVSAWQGVSF